MRWTAVSIIRRREVEIAVAATEAEIGHESLVDAMGAGDDPTLRGLPEHLRQTHDRHSVRPDNVSRHPPWSDRWNPALYGGSFFGRLHVAAGVDNDARNHPR
jgi:hypothetical protein